MRSEEFARFFTIMREGVSTFGTQWAALAARRYYFGAISGDGYVSKPDNPQRKINLLINLNPWLRELHLILFELAFGVAAYHKVLGNDFGIKINPTKGGREDVTKKIEILVLARNTIITVARQFDRPGIDNEFMSPLKRGKLTFLAKMLKRGAVAEDKPGEFDVSEEEAVEDDRRRWGNALLRVDEVLRNGSDESRVEGENTDSEVDHHDDGTDSDTASDADACCDTDSEASSASGATD